ncbi:hypothetical protein HDV04_004179 [Boothiomyces sp. JEL0838]|nr:hypothetical protein HDV04_004179 [Boothiomyces sp. JEL0838]
METISLHFKNTKPITELFELERDFTFYDYFTTVLACYDQFEVIDRIIGLSLNTDNIIQLGYTNFCGKGGIISTGNTHYEIGFPNTLVQILKNREWSELFNAIGQDNLTFLLLNCSVFVSVKSNLYQLCGPIFTNVFKKEKQETVEKIQTVEWQRVLYGNPTFSNGKINCKPNIDFNIFKIKKKKRFEKIKEFVEKIEKRHEQCNYKELMNDDPKIRDIDWLYDRNNSITGFYKMQELLSTFLGWLINHFVITLLKTNYYVTETSHLKNKLIYIKYSDWKRMEYKLYNLENFTKCETENAHSVRLLLKQTGARIIVNQSKKNIQKFNYRTSLNQILKNAFSIFNYEKQENCDKFGSSCFGKNDIFKNLLTIKNYLLPKSAEKTACGQNLYFCKIDIQACFDTINQQLLLDTIEQFLQKPEYLIRKFGLIKKKRLEYKRAATDSNNFTNFHDYVSELDDIDESIFVDSVNYQFESKDKIMKLLETHLLNHTIKIGKRCFKQNQGIPQGSILSTLLCKMENEKLSKYKQGLMRYVDDFLFMSKDKDQVMEFCNLMHKGFADYGMTVNPAKTLLNFKHNYNGFEFNFTENEWFPWCGLLINSRTLNVLSDYSKFQGLHLKYTFSADLNKSPGKIFLNKTLQ